MNKNRKKEESSMSCWAFFLLTCFFHFLPSSAHLSLSFIYYTYNTVLSCWISSFFNYFFFFSSTICSHVQLQHPESSQEFAAAFFHRCPFSSFPFRKEERERNRRSRHATPTTNDMLRRHLISNAEWWQSFGAYYIIIPYRLVATRTDGLFFFFWDIFE